MARKILRPNRGTQTELESSDLILAEGEVVMEVPDTGAGTGDIKIKVGDGVNKYADLPYAIDMSNAGSGATIKVGTTTTGDPGTNANVSNSGTDQDVILDFVIPRGEAGEKGDSYELTDEDKESIATVVYNMFTDGEEIDW